MENKKTLLIAEESLIDLNGHFYDYVYTIREAAVRRGWKVHVAAHSNVTDPIKKSLNAFPVFSHARFADQHKRRRGDRYFGLIIHNWSTFRNLWLFLKTNAFDLTFVPTTLAHHLLAWWLIMKFHPNRPGKLVLLFLNTPAVWNSEMKTTVLPPRAKVVGMLVRLFKGLQQKRQVCLAVQTKSAKKEMEQLTGMTFELFPQPVNSVLTSPSVNQEGMRFGFFGFTRYEKGSDIFINALRRVLKQGLHPKVKFAIQWTSSFLMPDGSVFELDDELANHPNVELIRNSLSPADYYRWLASTDCLILPYRNSSYYSRDSRITIEAITSGRPVIYTTGGWLDETVKEFGAGIGIEDENEDELTKGILKMNEKLDFYKNEAGRKSDQAKNYYSGDFFVELLEEKSAVSS